MGLEQNPSTGVLVVAGASSHQHCSGRRLSAGSGGGARKQRDNSGDRCRDAPNGVCDLPPTTKATRSKETDAAAALPVAAAEGRSAKP